MNAHHDDNGASLQPQDEGRAAFTRAKLVLVCIALAGAAVGAGAIGSIMGAW